MAAVLESPRSPNGIPQRTSSAGLCAPPAKSVLRPLPEETCLRHRRTVAPNTSDRRARQDAAARGEKKEHAGRDGVGDFGSDLIDQESRHWPQDKEKVLMGPFDYMESHPGKDIRSQLIAAFNAWLKVPAESLDIITKVVGMLHTSSLLIDDVEDDSLLRRGVPVAHSIFGTAQTINSANYVYFLALKELQRLQNPHAIDIFTEELLNLHRGQGMDLWWRDTLTCPSEAEYLGMVDNKTGGLFRLAVKLMQAESNSTSNCVPLVNAIGLIFQILDDYKNLSSEIYMQNKGLAEDLTEGKFSFPIIHCIRSDPTNHVLINILKQKPKDDDVKHYAIAYMERTGSFAYTRERLRELTNKAIALADEMERNSEQGSGDGVRFILGRLEASEMNGGDDGRSRPSQSDAGSKSLPHQRT